MKVPYLPVLIQLWQTVHFKNRTITVKFVVLANIAVICSTTNTASPWGPSLHDTLQHILASLNTNRMHKRVHFTKWGTKTLFVLNREMKCNSNNKKYILYTYASVYKYMWMYKAPAKLEFKWRVDENSEVKNTIKGDSSAHFQDTCWSSTTQRWNPCGHGSGTYDNSCYWSHRLFPAEVSWPEQPEMFYFLVNFKRCTLVKR